MATKTHEELQAEVTKLRTEQNTFKNAESAGETITIGGYLVERLAQLEVTVSIVVAWMARHCAQST